MAFLNKLKKVGQIVKDVKDNLTGRHLMFFLCLQSSQTTLAVLYTKKQLSSCMRRVLINHTYTLLLSTSMGNVFACVCSSIEGVLLKTF